MKNITKDKYIILELIPTSLKPENGQLVQLSAIKMDGLKVIDRFDYRLNEDKIKLKDIIDIISYDKDCFKYVDEVDELWNDFNKWSDNLTIIHMDDPYTLNYINHLTNAKALVHDYLDIPYTEKFIETIIDKYKLEPTNYIVDLLLEALIYHSNEIEK